MLTLAALVAPAHAELVQVLMESGPYQVSIDGAGSAVVNGMSYDITRPSAGSTVRAAFAAVASTYLAGNPGRNSLTVGGVALTLDSFRSDDAGNVITRFDDVTLELGAFLNALPVGTSAVPVTEGGSPLDNDGNLLFVVWEDPQFDTASVALSLGSALTDELPRLSMVTVPLDTTVPGFQVEVGVGISFSAGFASQQSSKLVFEGNVLTSKVGGFEDGEFANGGLFTIGGDGDGRSAERFDVTPLVSDGNTRIDMRLGGLIQDDFAVALWQFAPGVEVPCNPDDPGAIGFATEYFADFDGDGAGDPGLPTVTCDGPPPAFVVNDEDCDDTDPSRRPGFCLTISPGPVAAGAPLDVTVGGAQPGERIVVMLASGLGGTCPPQLGGVCIDLGIGARRFDSAIADATGTAVIQRAIPATAPSQAVRFLQAVVKRPGLASEQSPVAQVVVP